MPKHNLKKNGKKEVGLTENKDEVRLTENKEEAKLTENKEKVLVERTNI